ncbi:MAG: collagen-like protein [Winogradskyella arenosi]
MKNFTYVLLSLTFLFMACEGDQGPPGLNGLSADEYAALSFEVSPVDFQYNPDNGLQEALIALPYNLLDSDVVLVYRLEDVVTVNGQATDAWSPLPQNFFLEDANIIQYVFNHTYADVELLIDGNFELSTLDSAYTQNQVFRIVILPADLLNLNIDVSQLDDVIEAYNITDFEAL